MADYREMLGWPVSVDGSGPMLRLGCGIVAVEFLAGQGRDVLAVLRARNSLDSVLGLQTPAIPPPTARAKRSDPDHGGAGNGPRRPRSRRVPPDDKTPHHEGMPWALNGGMT